MIESTGPKKTTWREQRNQLNPGHRCGPTVEIPVRTKDRLIRWTTNRADYQL